MLKHSLRLVLGIAAAGLIIYLIVFSLNSDNDSGSRAVAVAFVLAAMIYEVREKQERRFAELVAKLDRLQTQVDAARDYSSHAALEAQQLRRQIEPHSHT